MQVYIDSMDTAPIEIIGGTDGIMVNPGGDGSDNFAEDMTGQQGSTADASLLSNWFFVGGITGAVLLFSIILGIILGKKRIKKGIDPYES